MAKKSISDRIKSRQKIRILTFLASLAVIALLVQLLVAKNPKQSVAAACDFTLLNGYTSIS